MKTLKRFFLSFVLVLAFVAVASEAGGQDETVGFLKPLAETEEKGIHGRGAELLGFLVLLGAGLYGAVHWQKKRGKHQGASIQVVAVKPVGQREKVAVLEVLGEQMVLGVTAHRISLLSRGPVAFSRVMGEEEENT